MLPQETQNLINSLVLISKDLETQRFLKEIIEVVCQFPATNPDGGEWKFLAKTLKELQKSFFVFHPFKNKRKVAVYGSARTLEQDPIYQLAEQFSRAMVQQGYMLISGAGGGIMEAVNKGAPDDSFGLNIKLPYEQTANPFIANSPRLVTYNYFFTRKITFLKESDALVVFPGGYGTHDEIFEVLTLIQTGKSGPRPIVLMQLPHQNYWNHWLAFIRQQLSAYDYISKDDLKMCSICSTIDQASNVILSFYRVYHSLRYVGPYAVIRLNQSLQAEHLKQLNRGYADMIVQGQIEACEPFEEEVSSRDWLCKFRIKFRFNRINYSRLLLMIQSINDFADPEKPS